MYSYLVDVNRKQAARKTVRKPKRLPAPLVNVEIPVGSENRHSYIFSVHYGVVNIVVQTAGKVNGKTKWYRDTTFSNIPMAWAKRWFNCKLFSEGERNGRKELFGRGLITTAKLNRALADRREIVKTSTNQ